MIRDNQIQLIAEAIGGFLEGELRSVQIYLRSHTIKAWKYNNDKNKGQFDIMVRVKPVKGRKKR